MNCIENLEIGNLKDRQSDGTFNDLDQTPGLGLGQGSALLDHDHIALMGAIVLVMGMELGALADIFAELWVFDLALNNNRDRLAHLVTGDTTDERASNIDRFTHEGLPAFIS